MGALNEKTGTEAEREPEPERKREPEQEREPDSGKQSMHQFGGDEGGEPLSLRKPGRKH